jgi:8-oxo-dGTP pyrophosphatase MutT (NUDIX family)
MAKLNYTEDKPQKLILASGPVIVENNKVLLDQHGDTEFWKFCGGRTENFNSDLITIAKNRAKEEMGIDIEVINPEPFLMYVKKETPEGNIDVILIHYLSKRIGKISPADFVKKWDWLPLENLNNENLAPNIIPTLKHFNFLA